MPEDEGEPPAGSRPRLLTRWSLTAARPLRACVPAADALLSVLLAPSCLACHLPIAHPLDGPVCAACWSSIAPLSPPLCAACGDVLVTWRTVDPVTVLCPRCRQRPSPMTLARSAGAYEGVLREVLHALKYEGRRTLAVRLGALMRDRGAEVLAGADLAVPVPLHWRRLHARGFNQADDLARQLGLPVVRALRRIRATAPQFGLAVPARLRNVRGAFAAPRRGPWCRRRHDERLRGARVVLVDDVCTTGATLDACAKVILEGGAREARGLTAARALSRRP